MRETLLGMPVDLHHVHQTLEFVFHLEPQREQTLPLGLHLVFADLAGGSEPDDSRDVQSS